MLRTFVSAVCRCHHWLSYAITAFGYGGAFAVVAGTLLTVVLAYKRTSACECAFSSHASSVHLIIASFFIISFFLLLTLFYFFLLYLPYSFSPSIPSHSPIFTHYSL